MFRLKEKTKGGWLVLQIGHWKSFWPCKLDLPTQYADRDVARWEIDQMDKFLHLHCHIFHHYEWNSQKIFVPSRRGLRQGDLLSPFLFVLVMEGPSKMLCKTRDLNLDQGFLSECKESSKNWSYAPFLCKWHLNPLWSWGKPIKESKSHFADFWGSVAAKNQHWEKILRILWTRCKILWLILEAR